MELSSFQGVSITLTTAGRPPKALKHRHPAEEHETLAPHRQGCNARNKTSLYIANVALVAWGISSARGARRVTSLTRFHPPLQKRFHQPGQLGAVAPFQNGRGPNSRAGKPMPELRKMFSAKRHLGDRVVDEPVKPGGDKKQVRIKTSQRVQRLAYRLCVQVR